MTKRSQCKKILDYLLICESITAWEAMENLRIMRLASRIHDLRKLGHNISGEMVTENGKRFMRYRLEEEA